MSAPASPRRDRTDSPEIEEPGGFAAPAPGEAAADPAALPRLGLILAGLLLAPSWHGALAAVLLLYLGHCAVLRTAPLRRRPARPWHRLDLAWGLAVVAAAGGTAGHDLAYLFLLFPVVAGALQRGTREGLGLALLAAGGGLLLGLVGPGPGGAGQWQLALPPAAALLALGVGGALWGGGAARRTRHLRLLGDLNRLPNPRFGPERLIAATLEQVRAFHAADACLAVLAGDGPPRLHLALRDGGGIAATDFAGLEAALLAPPPHCAIVAGAPSRQRRLFGGAARIEGVAGEELAAAQATARAIAPLLGGAWISLPLDMRGGTRGRLYLLSRRRRFGAADLRLLRRAMDAFLPLLDTVSLLDGLATQSAQTERHKICLDLHDSAIQPYLGLRLGLEAMRRKLEPSNPLAGEIDELYRMTEDSIAELRGYVRELGGDADRARQRAALLEESLRVQVARFRGFYGFEVAMNLPADLRLNDRLAAEVVQMIGESLSNIGRHTDARRVTINVSADERRLLTEVINHGVANDASWQRFTPRSLSRRAQHLGGSVAVQREAGGGSAVRVSIPL